MGELLSAVRDHALKRPWLLAVPLLGLLGQNVVFLLPGEAVAVKTMLTALMTAAVTTVFAELWLGDGWSLNPGRFVETGTLFLIPYPLLLVFGALTTPLVYTLLRADVPQAFSTGGLYLVLAAGKIAAFAMGAASSIAAARRREASGALAALRLGAATVLTNTAFFLTLLVGLWVFQEACVFLARSLTPGLLAGFLTTAIPLLGCVAAPIEAWRSGRLSR